MNSQPNHIVIDDLFKSAALIDVLNTLKQPQHWETQQHTYSELYVDEQQWLQASSEERFVQRDSWVNKAQTQNADNLDSAQLFLHYLRSKEFMQVLSEIFNVTITDMHVEEPALNTNYFRLSADDFVEQHADDSPGREICMLLYLNNEWQQGDGGELVFSGDRENQVSIAPTFNRCVLFDPSSKGSEHWVNRLTRIADQKSQQYRYNITSWYWSE